MGVDGRRQDGTTPCNEIRGAIGSSSARREGVESEQHLDLDFLLRSLSAHLHFCMSDFILHPTVGLLVHSAYVVFGSTDDLLILPAEVGIHFIHQGAFRAELDRKLFLTAHRLFHPHSPTATASA
jgi:hypothetical protein